MTDHTNPPDSDLLPDIDTTVPDSTRIWAAAQKDLGGIDFSVPDSARMWNHWLDGKENYQADQHAADQFAAIYPRAKDLARASEYFRCRIVRTLAEEGVDQFLDIGVGLPARDPTHAVAQTIIPDTHVVYIDKDTFCAAHAAALLVAEPPGRTDAVKADLARPDRLLQLARASLDFTRPVGILLFNVVRHIGVTDAGDQAQPIIDALIDALPPDGYLALADATNTHPAHVEAVRSHNQTLRAHHADPADLWHLRSPEQLHRLLHRLDLLDPGLVPITGWRPELDHHPDLAGHRRDGIDAWGALGRKTQPHVPRRTSR